MLIGEMVSVFFIAQAMCKCTIIIHTEQILTADYDISSSICVILAEMILLCDIKIFLAYYL